MAADTPSLAQIRELLDFLPVFSGEDFQPVLEWVVSEPDSEGITHFPYPVYRPEVLEFFQRAGLPIWSDYDYLPAKAARLIADPEFIRTADLEGIKTLLTYCVRGERFCDGHWETLLTTGSLVRILKRLEHLAA